jgi:hypothetical protein
MNADKTNASQAQHDALELQPRVVEAEQQADPQARRPKVVDALRWTSAAALMAFS